MLLGYAGQTYDRKSIENWLARGHRVCPLTGKDLGTNTQLVTNWALKAMTGSWLDTTGSSRASTAAPAVRYPNLQATGPEDRLAQVADILKRLKSPSIEASTA